MPANPIKAFVEAIYFALVVGVSTLLVQEGLFDDYDTSGSSIVIQSTVVLASGAIAYVIHAFIFAPLHMNIVWHRKHSHNPLEITDLPLSLNNSNNGFACHISLQPSSILSRPWLLFIRRLNFVPVILSESPSEVQMSCTSGGSTVFPAQMATSGVKFEWAGQAHGRYRLRASGEVTFYVEDPDSVRAGPTPLHYRLRHYQSIGLPTRDRKLHEVAIDIMLKRWVKVYSDTRNVHLD